MTTNPACPRCGAAETGYPSVMGGNVFDCGSCFGASQKLIADWSVDLQSDACRIRELTAQLTLAREQLAERERELAEAKNVWSVDSITAQLTATRQQLAEARSKAADADNHFIREVEISTGLRTQLAEAREQLKAERTAEREAHAETRRRLEQTQQALDDNWVTHQQVIQAEAALTLAQRREAALREAVAFLFAHITEGAGSDPNPRNGYAYAWMNKWEEFKRQWSAALAASEPTPHPLADTEAMERE